MFESRYFSLFTAESGARDSAAIMSALTSMQESSDHDLLLLNYFKEIPVCFAASIDSIGEGSVEIAPHKVQLVAMRDEKITFLKSDRFPHRVFARVTAIDAARQRVRLSNFSYAIIRSERREHVRIRVMEKIEVRFTSGDYSICGDLDDISIGGLSMLAPVQEATQPGSEGTASILAAGKEMELPCQLLSVTDLDCAPKYIFKLASTPRIENVISHFICQLQNETIRELKFLADTLR